MFKFMKNKKPETFDLPDLEMDTKIFVKDDIGGDWLQVHFNRWQEDGRVSFFDEGRTSFTGSAVSSCKYWKVIDDEHKCKTNCKQDKL